MTATHVRHQRLTMACAATIGLAIAWVLLKPAPSAAATALNRTLCGVFFVSAYGFFWLQTRRWGRPPLRALRSASAFLLFVAVTGTLGLHFGAVLSLPLRGGPEAYDFRVFSLLLLGVVGTSFGVRGLRATWSSARLDAWNPTALRKATAFLLFLTVPLMPLQDFAVAFTVAGAALLPLLWGPEIEG